MCISGGIFTAGGFSEHKKAPPEFVDPFSSQYLCKNPSPDPWERGLINMVGVFIGNSSILLCGGVSSYVRDSCDR